MAAEVKPRWAYFVVSFSAAMAATPGAWLKIGFHFSSNQPLPMVFIYQCASFIVASTGFRQSMVPARAGLCSDFASAWYSTMVFGTSLPAAFSTSPR